VALLQIQRFAIVYISHLLTLLGLNPSLSGLSVMLEMSHLILMLILNISGAKKLSSIFTTGMGGIVQVWRQQ
jgi:hypothetical protein